MPRVKSGKVTKARHKKVLKAAKGFRGARGTMYSSARDAVDRSLQYAYRDRRQRKRDFRRLWIARISAGVREHGMSYSRFMAGVTTGGIGLDRKMLADIAVHDPVAFGKIVEQVKAAAAS